MSGDQDDMGAFATGEPGPDDRLRDRDRRPGPVMQPDVEADAVEEAPRFVGPDAFQAKIIEPPPDEPAPDEPTKEEPKRALLPPGTTVTVVYKGTADVADLKGPDGMGEHDYRFRPGEPVDVPSEVAEELLTWPGEQFEIVEPKE